MGHTTISSRSASPRVIGERQLRDRPLVSSLMDRGGVVDRVEASIAALPAFSSREIERGVRALRSSVEAAPNAPLLMRLVRHPFALQSTRFQRQEVRTTLERRPERSALPKRDRLPARPFEGGSPAGRRLRPEPRPIPTAAEWLEVKGGGDE